MPFYFSSPYAPLEIWRYLEAYNPTPYTDAIGAGVLQWRNICNFVGRGTLVSVNQRIVHSIIDYRMSVDGGAWIMFALGTSSMTFLTGFQTSIQVQHLRTVGIGVNSLVWLNQE